MLEYKIIFKFLIGCIKRCQSLDAFKRVKDLKRIDTSVSIYIFSYLHHEILSKHLASWYLMRCVRKELPRGDAFSQYILCSTSHAHLRRQEYLQVSVKVVTLQQRSLWTLLHSFLTAHCYGWPCTFFPEINYAIPGNVHFVSVSPSSQNKELYLLSLYRQKLN